uniref:T4B21.14 protein n=2 Tax=Arabidopsis thaliana TaxID=3702 RepID=Q9ZSA1_ARATH|nr:contains similarity to human autoimmune regulator AIRE-1 (SW:O43918 [Arabidopsis thaliana]
MTDSSLPVPLHPPPRVPTPPLNPQELAAVTPYFPTSRPSAFQAFTVPTTQAGVRRHQVFPDSNISQASGAAITYGVRQVFEVGKSSRGAQDGESHNNMHLGESSKRKNLIILQRDKESRQHKQQETEQRMGGILKPPKKRCHDFMLAASVSAFISAFVLQHGYLCVNFGLSIVVSLQFKSSVMF